MHVAQHKIKAFIYACLLYANDMYFIWKSKFGLCCHAAEKQGDQIGRIFAQ
jgi:hypothetical protein